MISKFLKVLKDLFEDDTLRQSSYAMSREKRSQKDAENNRKLAEGRRWDFGNKRFSNGVYINIKLANERESIHRIPNFDDIARLDERYKPEIGVSHEFHQIDIELDGSKHVVWHPNQPKLICVTVTKSKFGVVIYRLVNSDVQKESETFLSLSDFSMGEILDMQHHLSYPHILLTCEDRLLVWDYENSTLIAELIFDDKLFVKGGFYPNQSQVWTLVPNRSRQNNWENREVHDWIIWDYEKDEFTETEIPPRYQYKTCADMHPSGKLGINVFDDYDGYGYFLFRLQSNIEVFPHYSEPSVFETIDTQIDQVCFSPDGRYVAFVSDVVWGKYYPRYAGILIHDLLTSEQTLRFWIGRSTDEKRLAFGYGGKTIAFLQDNNLDFCIYDAHTGHQITKLRVDSGIVDLSSHRKLGCYAVTTTNGLSIFVDETDTRVSDTDFEASSKDIAEEFMEEYANELTYRWAK